MKYLSEIIAGIMILLLVIIGFNYYNNKMDKAFEKWEEENPGCEIIEMCMNGQCSVCMGGDCEKNGYNKICTKDLNSIKEVKEE